MNHRVASWMVHINNKFVVHIGNILTYDDKLIKNLVKCGPLVYFRKSWGIGVRFINAFVPNETYVSFFVI